MKRCSPCNRSRHYNCQKASCECKCRDYSDTITKTVDPDRLSNPENDDFANDINERFKELKNG